LVLIVEVWLGFVQDIRAEVEIKRRLVVFAHGHREGLGRVAVEEVLVCSVLLGL
jgi:hypothetical protein